MEGRERNGKGGKGREMRGWDEKGREEGKCRVVLPTFK